MQQTAIEKVRQAREDAFEAIAELDERIADTHQRIEEVCRRGTLPFDEAFPAWRKSFEAYADRGQRELERRFEEFCRPKHIHPVHGSVPTGVNAGDAFHFREYPSGKLHDTGSVFSHLHREAIIEHARAWFEAKCANCNVPPAQERQAELDRLGAVLADLQAERDDITDQLSELFDTEPSERTSKAVKAARHQQHVDHLNRVAEESVGRGQG